MKQKILDGSEVAGYIKQRHYITVKSLERKPTLVVVDTNPTNLSEVYIRIKRQYAEDIGVGFRVITTDENRAKELIQSLNSDKSVDGIVLQLPLKDKSITDDLINSIDPIKDVDGLRFDSLYPASTAQAIMWLLSAYQIDLAGKHIVVVGQGRLVGLPISGILLRAGHKPDVVDEFTSNPESIIIQADVLITATGKPGLITPEMVRQGAVVVDAGTASENGEIVGDVSPEVRNREDVTITPLKGGVGPLTIAALYDNLLSPRG